MPSPADPDAGGGYLFRAGPGRDTGGQRSRWKLALPALAAGGAFLVHRVVVLGVPAGLAGGAPKMARFGCRAWFGAAAGLPFVSDGAGHSLVQHRRGDLSAAVFSLWPCSDAAGSVAQAVGPRRAAAACDRGTDGSVANGHAGAQPGPANRLGASGGRFTVWTVPGATCGSGVAGPRWPVFVRHLPVPCLFHGSVAYFP